MRQVSIIVRFPDGRTWSDGVRGIKDSPMLRATMLELVENVFETAGRAHPSNRMPSPIRATRIELMVEPDLGEGPVPLRT